VSDDLLALIPLLFGVGLIPVAGVPMARMAATGVLERNGVAGIRTRHTQASDAAWAAGHAAALPRVSRTVPVAITTVVATVITTVLGGSGWGAAVGVTGLLVETVVLVSAAGVANAAARKAAFPGAEG
jgi:hypothetical protein